MAILCNKHTRLLVQGMGRVGQFHAKLSIEYGTKVVAGVHPGKGGQTIEGISLFNTVAQAVADTGADASVIFVPAGGAPDAILEAADAGLPLVVCITEGIPGNDMARVKEALAGSSMRLIGPNCPGLVTPGQCRIGIMPARITRPGSVGVISRSGTLTYEAVDQLSRIGIGQSTCVGIGGDKVPGSTFVDILALFEADPETRAVVMIGEIGGDEESSSCEDEVLDIAGVDFGAMIGAGIDVGAFSLGVRYEFGLTNIPDEDDFDGKNKTLSFVLGYTFGR